MDLSGRQHFPMLEDASHAGNIGVVKDVFMLFSVKFLLYDMCVKGLSMIRTSSRDDVATTCWPDLVACASRELCQRGGPMFGGCDTKEPFDVGVTSATLD